MKHKIWIVLGIIIFLMLTSWWGFFSVLHPLKIYSHLTPQDFNLSYENIHFRTEDNVLIRAWFIPSKNPQAKTIILLHGYGADKGNILPSRLFLHDEYHLLFFDFRYFGESEGKYSTVGLHEIKDLRAAIKYLKKRGINEVGVWGLSMGGAVALMAAKTMPEIKAVVAESSYARLDLLAENYYQFPVLRYPLSWLTRLWAYLVLGLDAKSISPSDSSRELTIPILLIHSKNDALIPFVHAELLEKALENNPRAEFMFVETGSHGEFRKTTQKKIEDFFKRAFE